MTFPRDYRQERTYGLSAVGVILTLVGVIVIMFVVVILSGAVFFPFGGSFEIETSPEQQAALPSLVASTILTAAIPIVVIIGSWIYSRGRIDSENQ